jgi:lysophospholipase L1-like esterase
MKPTQSQTKNRFYLALGDSMSIDIYTRVQHGGAVSQLIRRLQGRQPEKLHWRLDDRTLDGQVIAGVDFRRSPHGPADLITITIGGNDLLQNMRRPPADFIPEFTAGYQRLMTGLRQAHAGARIVVGNIYHPQGELPPELAEGLELVNEFIGSESLVHDFRLADIHAAFLGHEDEYLTLGIEPSHAGATVIADLFERAADQHP